MSKYYTPEIEEFRIGFEYEWLNEDSVWIKESSPTEISKESFNEQTYGLRVKYLDREDIESLGWQKHSALENVYYKDLTGKNLYGTVYLNYNHNGKEILIEDDRTGYYLFKGYIKNKSELKTLLKQLNIK